MQLQLTACKTHCWFSVSCSFFFTIFVLCLWKNLSCQAATSSASKPLVASNFDVEGKHESSGFFDLDFQQLYLKIVTGKLFEQIVVEYNSKKVLPDHQQRAKLHCQVFGKLCAFFTIFVLCQWKNLGRQTATSSARETLATILAQPRESEEKTTF